MFTVFIKQRNPTFIICYDFAKKMLMNFSSIFPFHKTLCPILYIPIINLPFCPRLRIYYFTLEGTRI